MKTSKKMGMNTTKLFLIGCGAAMIALTGG